MNVHSYLRAYMAGILLPTWFLVLVLAAFLVANATQSVPARVERVLIFPMAVVPNLWGLWNLLYTALELRGRVSIGVFGAVLPLLLVPAGLGLAFALDLDFYRTAHAAVVMPLAMGLYYLVWKYGVAFLNRVVGLG